MTPEERYEQMAKKWKATWREERRCPPLLSSMIIQTIRDAEIEEREACAALVENTPINASLVAAAIRGRTA